MKHDRPEPSISSSPYTMLLKASASSFSFSTVQGVSPSPFQSFSSVSPSGLISSSSSSFLPTPSQRKGGEEFVVLAKAKESNSQLMTGVVFEPFEEMEKIQRTNQVCKEASEEERAHAGKLMKFQNTRGGKVVLQPIVQPQSEFYDEEKGDGLYERVPVCLAVMIYDLFFPATVGITRSVACGPSLEVSGAVLKLQWLAAFSVLRLCFPGLKMTAICFSLR
ncbi:hypothetical protein NE237_005369 [Protea cynaroides]|uniref:Uncharacterized protein n=1 Tax=Protea cynaroides TaxID=273540 RepID=A0A9Q0QUH2_9MAGN|nr:hypothetical protein NE237_005369 [Protea cynaroides]